MSQPLNFAIECSDVFLYLLQHYRFWIPHIWHTRYVVVIDTHQVIETVKAISSRWFTWPFFKRIICQDRIQFIQNHNLIIFKDNLVDDFRIAWFLQGFPHTINEHLLISIEIIVKEMNLSFQSYNNVVKVSNTKTSKNINLIIRLHCFIPASDEFFIVINHIYILVIRQQAVEPSVTNSKNIRHIIFWLKVVGEIPHHLMERIFNCSTPGWSSHHPLERQLSHLQGVQECCFPHLWNQAYPRQQVQE